MEVFEKTISTNKSFDDAVAAVEKKTAEKGFQVLYTHDVAATLAEKGFAREPLKIIEICNAKYASQVLDKEVKLALMMPCPITVLRAGQEDANQHGANDIDCGVFPQGRHRENCSGNGKGVLGIIEEAK